MCARRGAVAAALASIPRHLDLHAVRRVHRAVHVVRQLALPTWLRHKSGNQAAESWTAARELAISVKLATSAEELRFGVVHSAVGLLRCGSSQQLAASHRSRRHAANVKASGLVYGRHQFEYQHAETAHQREYLVGLRQGRVWHGLEHG